MVSPMYPMAVTIVLQQATLKVAPADGWLLLLSHGFYFKLGWRG
jgi:hypothetical protein